MPRRRSKPDADSPEMGAEFFARAVSLDQARPELAQAIRRFRGKQKAPTKELVSIRLDRHIVSAYRATGKGWQGRINETLAEHLPRRTRQLKRTAGRQRASRHD